MRKILHLIVGQKTPWLDAVIRQQQAANDCTVQVIDLSAAPGPDYQILLKAAFDADAVDVW